MSIVDWDPVAAGALPTGSEGTTSKSKQQRPLHRLATVRRRQDVSLRNVARRLRLDMGAVRAQEEETADLTLTQLYAWQQVLEVPVAELLVDCDGPLSPPVMERARMVKLMKTAAAIMEKAQSRPIERLAQMMMDQLLEIMPELKDVGPWHVIGPRRDDNDREEIALPEALIKRLS
jgi:transcriptional regulator with XRE-family HTH domain